jgi:protocatechuate 3,4-dioxygenase beta subunit
MGRIAYPLVLFVLAGTARGGTLRGTVEDRTGAPAPGALVWATRLESNAPLDVRQSAADERGQFLLDVSPGPWMLRARRGDEGVEGVLGMREVREGSDPEPVTVRLGPPTCLRGRLFDEATGRPIAGGRIVLDDARVLTTDNQGRFYAPGLPMGHRSAEAFSPGRERKTVLFDTTFRRDAELEIRLARAGRIIGRVTDGDGRPVPGAAVKGSHSSGHLVLAAANWELCAPDGSFAWDGVPLNRMEIGFVARAPGFLVASRDPLRVESAETPLEVNFTLKPDPSSTAAAASPHQRTDDEPRCDVTGVVVDHSGRALEGVRLKWGVTFGDRETRTDAVGRFGFRRVLQSGGNFVAFVPGYLPAFHSVRPGGDREVRVTLERGDTTVRGRVRDETGAPLAGVQVIPHFPSGLSGSGQGFSSWDLGTTTDAQGGFVFPGMSRKSPPKFSFFADHKVPVRNRPLALDDGSGNVVVMQSEGALCGRVLDSRGQPVRNFRLVLSQPTERRAAEQSGGAPGGYATEGVSFTSADGTFLVSGLETGRAYSVKVLANGFRMAQQGRVLADSLDRLRPADAFTMTLSPPVHLRVLVRDANGGPIEDASISLTGLDQSNAMMNDRVEGRTGADGRADFPALMFADALVLVRARGFARYRVQWHDGKPELGVSLEPACLLGGVVLGATGEPIAGASVVLRTEPGEQFTFQTEPGTGRYLFAELPPGRHALYVYVRVGAEQLSHSSLITLEAGKTYMKDVEFDDVTSLR